MSWDPVWEKVFNSQAWGKYPAEDLIRFVAQNFYRVPGRGSVRILELGCGPGANLWYMAREGFGVCGIDGSETAIRLAKERLDGECPGWVGQLQVGDITSLPWPDGYFDAVIDSEVVCCNDFAISKRIYGEAARVTKKDGLLFVRTFASGCWGEGSGEEVGHHAWNCSEGPLAGKGYARFSSSDDIPALLADWKVSTRELLTRTAANQQHAVIEWLITASRK